MADATSDYLALRQEVGAVRIDRDVVRASGLEAVGFLQGQLSQDVDALSVGGSAWSLLLTPQGRVDAWLRVTRAGDEELVLDVDRGYGDAVVERLNRFKLRTRCDLEPLRWQCVAVRGPAAATVDAGGQRVYPIVWPGLAGFDLLGDDVAVPVGVPECGTDAYEAVRIEAGVPRLGVELTDRTIPAEAGQWLVDASVSFTKGCFTGQELVARIDSRGGNVPRPLRGVVVQANVVPPAGAELRDGEANAVGVLTSVAESLTRRAPVALALVQRRVEPPAEVTVAWDGGQAPARIEHLPLVP